MKKCKWIRAFDNHFNISCDSGERANGKIKGKELALTKVEAEQKCNERFLGIGK